MSLIATSWAFDVDLPPAEKLILMTYADFADETGAGAWATKTTLAKRVRRVSQSTINRKKTTLLEHGWMREGDQSRVGDYWKSRPAASRPIVYDVALDEATRQAWADAYRPDAGVRGAASAAGRVGGQVSAQARRDARTEPQVAGGVNLTPPSDADPAAASADVNAQVAGGVKLTPHDAEGADLQPGGVAPGATGGVAELCNPRTSHERTYERSFRDDAPSAHHHGRGGATDGQQATARKPHRRVERSEADQARWDVADEIARKWWEGWQARGVTIVGNKFPGFRKSIVLAALEAGADPEHVCETLRRCNEPFPPLARFQRELAAIQDPTSTQSRTTGRGAQRGPWRDTTVTAEEHARLAAQFDGVSVNGKRIQ